MKHTTQGFILLDVDVVALNNAGKSNSTNFDNAVATKKVTKNNRTYTYVSGQAWRYWWREALQKNHNWELSPVTRDNKIAFTEANPLSYADDDIFGYMRAAKDVERDTDGNAVVNKQGKEKKVDVTVTRVSPLKNSAIISVGPVSVSENWSSMARQEGDSVPYGKEEYSTIMKGMFSIDLSQVGTFSSYNKTGYKNITDKLKEEALSQGAEEIEDDFVKSKDGKPMKLVRIKKDIRDKRVQETIRALKTINGGAMQTSNMADVTPKFILLATLDSANHPFSHVAVTDKSNFIKLNIDGLKEVISEYSFKGNIYIGRRNGFMDEFSEELAKLANDFSNVKVLPVNEAIEEYSKEVVNYL